MDRYTDYGRVADALAALGFEMNPTENTVLLAGRETPVEMVVDLGLPLILEALTRHAHGERHHAPNPLNSPRKETP
ncbi:MAG: hypothetical protein HY719_03215 [Planctomycetes bacterium]|nr:hypothetical protein [Planctomycetota bacterium]